MAYVYAHGPGQASCKPKQFVSYLSPRLLTEMDGTSDRSARARLDLLPEDGAGRWRCEAVLRHGTVAVGRAHAWLEFDAMQVIQRNR